MSEEARLQNSSISDRSPLSNPKLSFQNLFSLRISSSGDSSASGSYSRHLASSKRDSSLHSTCHRSPLGGQQCRPSMLGRIRLKGWEQRMPLVVSGEFPLRHRGFFNMYIDPHTAEQDQHLSRFQQLKNGMNDGTDGNRTVKLLCAGGLAGAVSRTVTAPIDRLKFLSQVHRSSHLTIRQGLSLMANEGTVKAYFRGNGANVMKNIPETALKLTLNDRIKDKICNGGHSITLGERLTVAALSGAIAQAAIYPLEVIQTRLAATHGVYSGILDVAHTLWYKEGPRALYRGVTPCLIGILPYAGLDITAFELMKDKLFDHYGGLPPPYMLLSCGMLSSSGAQCFAYPFGLIRTRLQMDALSKQPYNGMVDCFWQVLRQEGWRGLFKGFGMSLAKIAPAAGISWFIYEESKALLGCQDEAHQHHHR